MSLPTLGKYCIEKSKCTPWPLYIRLRGFIGVPFRERERREISSRSIVSTTTTYRRRYGTPCLVSRLEIVPRGQKTHGSTTVREEGGEEGGGKREGGVRGISKGEGRMDWKEGREREREGDGNNRWEGWGMDAVIWRCMHHRLCHLAREDRPT